MPTFTSDFNYGTGTLNASRQGDALLGYGGDVAGDSGQGIVNAVLGERRRKEAREEHLADRERRRQQMAERQGRLDMQRQEALAADEPFRRMRTASSLETGFRRDRGGNLSALIGGPQAQHFQDYAARMAGMQAAGVPIYDYTGMKDIVQGNAGAGTAAVEQAGANLRQQRQLSPAGLQLAALMGR